MSIQQIETVSKALKDLYEESVSVFGVLILPTEVPCTANLLAGKEPTRDDGALCKPVMLHFCWLTWPRFKVYTEPTPLIALDYKNVPSRGNTSSLFCNLEEDKSQRPFYECDIMVKQVW